MRDSSSKSTHRYCEEHTSPPSELLRDLERITHLSTVAPQMASGPYQGKLIELISRMLRPDNVLEIGTFTGYATICLATGLSDNGRLDTIEADPEKFRLINLYMEKAGLSEKVNLHLGDALELIAHLDTRYDLVFVDAGKRDYARYFELILPKLRSGGVLIFDNMLWGGKVVSGADDADTSAIDELNKRLSRDKRVDVVLLPVRDGISIIMKN